MKHLSASLSLSGFFYGTKLPPDPVDPKIIKKLLLFQYDPPVADNPQCSKENHS